MELHTCTNCELIDQVISNEVQKFDILTEENVALHGALIKAREYVVRLESEVSNLYNVLTAERQRNLQLYLQQQHFSHESLIAMNVILNPDAKETGHKKYVGSIRKLSSKPSSALLQEKDEQVSLSKYNKLREICDEQERIYEDNLLVLQKVNDNYVLKLKEQMSKLEDHALMVLEMYSVYRSELFKQKKKNVDERKRLLETVNTLHKANAKYMHDLKKKMLANNAVTVTEQIKDVLNSVNIQAERRDKLVTTLRRQQMCLETQIEKLKKQEEKQLLERNKVISDLRKQLKYCQEKYSALERRRAFDAEGFRTDVDHIRKNILKFKSNYSAASHKCDYLLEHQKLEQELDGLDKKLRSCYVRQNA